MNIAVIGSGKTGSKVVELLGEECGEVFEQDNPVDVQRLKQHDAVIIFIPGNSLKNAIRIFDIYIGQSK